MDLPSSLIKLPVNMTSPQKLRLPLPIENSMFHNALWPHTDWLGCPKEADLKQDAAGFCDESSKNNSCLINQSPSLVGVKILQWWHHRWYHRWVRRFLLLELQHVYSISYWLESLLLGNSHTWTWISCRWKKSSRPMMSESFNRQLIRVRTNLIEGKQWKPIEWLKGLKSGVGEMLRTHPPWRQQHWE